MALFKKYRRTTVSKDKRYPVAAKWLGLVDLALRLFLPLAFFPRTLANEHNNEALLIGYDEWMYILVALVLYAPISIMVHTEIRIILYPDRLVKGIMHPWYLKMKKLETVYEPEVKEICVQQDADRYYHIILVTRDGRQIFLTKNANLHPLVDDFDFDLEKQGWHEHKLNLGKKRQPALADDVS